MTGTCLKLALALLTAVAVVLVHVRPDRPPTPASGRPAFVAIGELRATTARSPADPVADVGSDRRPVTLPRLSTRELHGRVRMADGGPAANCAVVVTAVGTLSASVGTDSSGWFAVDLTALDDLTELRRAEIDLELAFDHPECLPAREEVEIARARDGEPMEFVLESARGHVLGTVLDAAGEPVADAIVFRSDTGEENRTDADGRFWFDLSLDESPGTTRLVALQENHGASRFVAVGADPYGVACAELRLVRPLGVVTGTVRDLGGRPVAGHRLELERVAAEDPGEPGWLRGLFMATVFTDENGRFRACGLEPGTFDVCFEDGLPDTGDGWLVRVGTGGPPCEVTVPFVRVDVEVVDRLGAPLESARLRFRLDPADNGDHTGDGWEELDESRRLWLSPGQAGELAADFPGAANAAQRLRIDGVRPQDVRLVLTELAPDAGVHLNVQRADGRPVGAVWLRVMEEESGWFAQLPLPHVGGAYLLPRDGLVRVMPGHYSVTVRAADDLLHPTLPAGFRVWAGAPAPSIDVRLPAGARIGIVVPSQSFLPPEDLPIYRCGRGSGSWASTELSLRVATGDGQELRTRLTDVRHSLATTTALVPPDHHCVCSVQRYEPGPVRGQVTARDSAPGLFSVVLRPGMNWLAVDRGANGMLLVRELR